MRPMDKVAKTLSYLFKVPAKGVDARIGKASSGGACLEITICIEYIVVVVVNHERKETRPHPPRRKGNGMGHSPQCRHLLCWIVACVDVQLFHATGGGVNAVSEVAV